MPSNRNVLSTAISLAALALLLAATLLLATRFIHEIDPPAQPIHVYYCNDAGCEVSR